MDQNYHQKRKFLPKWRGHSFSLIELLVVIAVIGILTTITVIAVQGARQRSKVALGKAALLEVASNFSACSSANYGAGSEITPPVSNTLGGGTFCLAVSEIWPSLQTSGWRYTGAGTGNTPTNPVWTADCDAETCGATITADCKKSGCEYFKETPGPVSTGPIIAFTVPEDGASVGNCPLDVAVSISDGVDLTDYNSYRIKIDGQTDATPPVISWVDQYTEGNFSFNDVDINLSYGPHTLTLDAIDVEGEEASESITINVGKADCPLGW